MANVLEVFEEFLGIFGDVFGNLLEIVGKCLGCLEDCLGICLSEHVRKFWGKNEQFLGILGPKKTSCRDNYYRKYGTYIKFVIN